MQRTIAAAQTCYRCEVMSTEKAAMSCIQKGLHPEIHRGDDENRSRKARASIATALFGNVFPTERGVDKRRINEIPSTFKPRLSFSSFVH